jgi:tetratricopeptide (TPR) repeat protein
MIDRLPRIMATATVILTLLWGGCAPTAEIKPPDTTPDANRRAVALGAFSGPYGTEVRQALAEALARRRQVRLDDQAAVVLSGNVEGQLEDIKGQDLVRLEKKTGRVEEVTITDPFVKKPFTYRAPVTESVVESKPFVVRRAWLDLKYALTDRPGAPGFGPDQARAASEIKYGGVNENLSHGPALKDLPPAEETMRTLARELAQGILDRVFPDPQAVVVLDDGPGLLGEKETTQGVALAQKGRWEEARLIWENILKDDPEHPAANYNLGVYWEHLGGRDHLERARDYYVKAAKTGNNPQYRKALTRITLTLRDNPSPTSD